MHQATSSKAATPYSSWRITFPSAEQAAQAAHRLVEDLTAKAAQMRTQNAQLAASIAQWQKNHAHMVTRCAYLLQRRDLPVDRLPAYQAHVRRIEALEELVKAQHQALDDAVALNNAEIRAHERLRKLVATGLDMMLIVCANATFNGWQNGNGTDIGHHIESLRKRVSDNRGTGT